MKLHRIADTSSSPSETVRDCWWRELERWRSRDRVDGGIEMSAANRAKDHRTVRGAAPVNGRSGCTRTDITPKLLRSRKRQRMGSVTELRRGASIRR